ncbi:MAG: PIN domain-containing protein [Chitinophagaceae bacterium]|jgi:predicted nucleic acid-binding protein|nr:PIN domain-containing protein [Chitinophagaceae bacterium]
MNDKFFVDSNVFLYLLDVNESKKKLIVLTLVEEIPFISSQVVFECLNVCLKKKKVEQAKALKFVRKLVAASFIQPETDITISTALLLYEKYSLQPYDSKIIASALLAGCNILYSEDMQHGLVVENKLTIINPFL